MRAPLAKVDQNHTKLETDYKQSKFESAKWRPLRITAFCTALLALSLCMTSLCTNHWIELQGETRGLFERPCFTNSTNDETSPGPDDECADKKMSLWIIAVIGTLVFTVVCSLLFIVLILIGFYVSSVARKPYFFHSAGEIALVCAINCVTAGTVYIFSLRQEHSLEQHSYTFGYSHVFCWVSSSLFALTSLLLCVDDVIRTVNRCKRRHRARRNENSVV